MNWKYSLLLILPIIAWMTYNYSVMSNYPQQNLERLQLDKESQSNDIIVEKGKDKWNRDTPYLKLKNSSRNSYDEIIWNKAEIGYSLVKVKNSATLKLVKKDTVIFIDYNDIYKHWDSIYKNEN